MSDLVTRLSVLAEDDGDRYPAHVKKLAEAAASRIAALEAQLAERAGGVNEDALRALAQAYDREDAAQRGEPDPWDLDDPGDIGDSDTWVSERLACARAAAEAFLSALDPAAPEGQQDNEPRAYIVHAPEDDYYGTGPDRLQFHPLAQHDMDNGYRQTPLYGRPAHELSGNTGELIDKMAEAIRGDTTFDDTPWATLSEDHKIGWRGDAERALAVVKEYLTARRPTEQAVTEAMVEAVLSWVCDDVLPAYGIPSDVPRNDPELPDSCRAALKAAKAAAQADYERRIRSALVSPADTSTEPVIPEGWQFTFNQLVRKKSGSWWEGRVVGWYSTAQTHRGYCVQLEKPNGPVQIYPENALEAAAQKEASHDRD